MTTTFDRALADSRLATLADLRERLTKLTETITKTHDHETAVQAGKLRDQLRGDNVADMAFELADSLVAALGHLDAIEEAASMTEHGRCDECGAPCNSEGCVIEVGHTAAQEVGPRITMPTTSSPDRAWVVTGIGGEYVVMPCSREHADNAIGTVNGDDLGWADTFEAAVTVAVAGHPARRYDDDEMVAYIRYDGNLAVHRGEDSYLIAM